MAPWIISYFPLSFDFLLFLYPVISHSIFQFWFQYNYIFMFYPTFLDKKVWNGTNVPQSPMAVRPHVLNFGEWLGLLVGLDTGTQGQGVCVECSRWWLWSVPFWVGMGWSPQEVTPSSRQRPQNGESSQDRDAYPCCLRVPTTESHCSRFFRFLKSLSKAFIWLP